MSGTSIQTLPTDPAGGGSVSGNVQLSTTESVAPTSAPNVGTGPIQLSTDTISELVKGIQQASNTGATSLPTRDLPINETSVSMDKEVQPDYVPEPEPEMADYIKDYDDTYSVLENIDRSTDTIQQAENIYEEIQIPIIVLLCYFLFQLPAFKKYERLMIPGLYGTDGNITLVGLAFNSIMIALIVFLIRRVLTNI